MRSELQALLHALGTLADPDAFPVLALAARFDPEPSVRSAAVRALRNFEGRATLELVAAHDPSPEVCALATQELAATARRP